MTFHEVTERTVQKAVARRVMNRMVGYVISPVLWKNAKVYFAPNSV